MSKAKERRQEILTYSEGRIHEELKTLRLRLFNLRLQQQRGEVKNNRLFTQTRKDIARLMYRLSQLENEE